MTVSLEPMKCDC